MGGPSKSAASPAPSAPTGRPGGSGLGGGGAGRRPSVVPPADGNPFEPSSALAAQAAALHRARAEAKDGGGGSSGVRGGVGGGHKYVTSPDGWQVGPAGLAEAKDGYGDGNSGAKMADDK